MKATVVTTTETLNLEVQTTSGKPDMAVQGGMYGIQHIVDGKPIYLYLPIKSLIKIEIHE